VRDVLIALFEKPLTKERETERKVLTQILCNPELNFAQPIFDFEEVLHLSAMARLRPDLVQPVIWETSEKSESILKNLRTVEQTVVSNFLGNSLA
jgi:hypothetical protein